MKRKGMYLVCFIISVVMLVGVTPATSAVSARASDYFWATEAWITPTGNGNFTIQFNVSATTNMKEVGISEIVIYEQESSGAYKPVKVFTRYNTAGLIATGTFGTYGTVSYSGTADTRYYAVVTFFAKDSNGSDTLKMTTNTITA